MNVNAVAPWEGQLVWVGTPTGGTTQNGSAWKSVDFTLKYTDHEMQERFITFSAFGVERVDKLLATPMNTMLRVKWWPDARKSEYNNETKWWPAFRVLGINVITPTVAGQPYPPQGTAMPQQAQPYQPPQPQPATYQQPVQAPAQQPVVPPSDDLPF